MIGWLEIKIERRDGAARMHLGPLEFDEFVPRTGEWFNYPGVADDGEWFMQKIQLVEWYGAEQVVLHCESDSDHCDNYDDDEFWGCHRPQWLQEEIEFRLRNGWNLDGERETLWTHRGEWGVAYDFYDQFYELNP